MKKYRLRYLTPARNDLVEIFEYIKLDNPTAASAFLVEVDRRLAALETFPRTGVVPKDKHLQRKRYLILVIDSYLAFYKISGMTVWIHRVLHGKRKYEHLL